MCFLGDRRISSVSGAPSPSSSTELSELARRMHLKQMMMSRFIFCGHDEWISENYKLPVTASFYVLPCAACCVLP